MIKPPTPENQLTQPELLPELPLPQQAPAQPPSPPTPLAGGQCNPRLTVSQNAGQLGLKDSPTRRAMIMAGNRMPTVDKKVASILAGVLTA